MALPEDDKDVEGLYYSEGEDNLPVEGVEGEPDLKDLETVYENPYPDGFVTENNVIPLYIVPRSEWGAAPAKEEAPSKHPFGNVLDTYSHTPSCYDLDQCVKTMRALQKRDMEVDGLPDIRYNFYMAGDLTVYEGRGWDNYFSEPHEGYKIKALAGKIVSICYIGEYDGENDWPSEGAVQVRALLLEMGKDQGYVKDMYSTMPVLIDTSDLDEITATIKEARGLGE